METYLFNPGMLKNEQKQSGSYYFRNVLSSAWRLQYMG